MAYPTYAYAGEIRDPRTAAALSVIPGLGQFYNGQSRKGMLFLDVAIINYILLSIMLLAPALSRFMQDVGLQFGMKVNHGILEAIKQMQFGSPVSLVVSGMVLAFIGYAIRDAYDHAQMRRRRALYKDCVIDLTEAASGSYIFHVSIIVSLALLALFFFIPKPPARQIVEIEFFNTILPAKPPLPIRDPIKKAASPDNTPERIKQFDRSKPIQKMPPKAELKPRTSNQADSASASAASSSPPPSAAQFRLQKPPAPSAFTRQLIAMKPAAPTFTPPISPLHLSAPASRVAAASPAMPVAGLQPPAPTTSAISMAPKALNPAAISAPLPPAPLQGTVPAQPQQLLSLLQAGGSLSHGNAQAMPAATSPAGGGLKNAVSLPAAGAPQLNGGGQVFSPVAGTTGGSKPGSFAAGTPGPVNIATHQRGNSDGATPQPMGKGHSGSHSGPDGTGNGPAPERSRHNGQSWGFSDGPVRVAISVGHGPAGDTQSGQGTSPRNFDGTSGEDSTGSKAMPDFSAYMANLQRQIKRAWYPPKEGQTKKVKVMFKIHTDGSMTNLRLTLPSGSSISDQAALTAVQNAAPFQHLPANSPDNVDIEFTFDYNVMLGRN